MTKFFRGIFEIFKNLFNKRKIKAIPEKSIISVSDKNDSFKEFLKVNNINNNKNKEIRTLVCYGTGLGINNKISY